MAGKYDAEIERLKEAMLKEESTMASLQSELLAMAEDFVKEWFWKETESNAKRNAELSKALGKARLGELKSEVQALQLRSHELTQQYVNAESLWCNWQKNPDGYQSVHLEHAVREQLRLSMGPLGPILLEYGYVPKDSDWSAPRQNVRNDGTPRYPYGVELPAALKDKIKVFESSANSWIKCRRELKDAESNKLREEASDLWDQA